MLSGQGGPSSSLSPLWNFASPSSEDDMPAKWASSGSISLTIPHSSPISVDSTAIVSAAGAACCHSNGICIFNCKLHLQMQIQLQERRYSNTTTAAATQNPFNSLHWAMQRFFFSNLLQFLHLAHIFFAPLPIAFYYWWYLFTVCVCVCLSRHWATSFMKFTFIDRPTN